MSFDTSSNDAARERIDAEDDAITFVASIPPIQSWMSIAGDGGARIKLDVPDSDIAQVLRLLPLRGTALRVSVSILPQ